MTLLSGKYRPAGFVTSAAYDSGEALPGWWARVGYYTDAAWGSWTVPAVHPVVVFLLASGSRRHHAIPANQGPAVDPAIEIARDRLARGEIDAEQYTRIVASLTGVTVPPRQA